MPNDDLHDTLVVIFGEVRRAWADAAPKPSSQQAIDERLGQVYLMIKDAKNAKSISECLQQLDDTMKYIREGGK